MYIFGDFHHIQVFTLYFRTTSIKRYSTSSGTSAISLNAIYSNLILFCKIGLTISITFYFFNDNKQVTGGANGIGFAIGIELARCGCKIAIADIDIDGAREAVEEFQLMGVKAFAYEVKI